MFKTNFSLPKNAKTIIDILKEHSFEAYIVGGSIRDILLGIKSHDIDITTNATPSKIISVFKNNFKTIETGIKYGTVTVIVEDEPVEITTFRSETSYVDGRHPDKIFFEKNINNDLMRRDFTINAMAYNSDKGLLDLFDGQIDLNNKIIRCVGTPIQRFQEDKLRMLRAVRLATTLDFTIESDTFFAIQKLSPYIKDVSIERINQEFSKLLLSNRPSKGIILLKETGLLQEILPCVNDMYGYEQNNPHHDKDLFYHTLEVLDNTKPDLILRLSALFHDVGKPYTQTIDNISGIAHYYGHNKISAKIVQEQLSKLRYSNEIIDTVTKLVYHHMIDAHTITPKGIRKLISSVGMDNIEKLVMLHKADSKYKTKDEKYIFENKVKNVLDESNVFNRTDLKINGFDLMNLGYNGKEIGQLLDYILDIVLENPILNEKDILIQEIHKYKTKSDIK